MRCGNLGSVVKRESASSNRHISLGDDELDCVDDKLRVPNLIKDEIINQEHCQKFIVSFPRLKTCFTQAKNP